MLAETDFHDITSDARRELVAFLEAPKSTLIVERFANLARRVERRNGTGQLGPLSCWHRLFQSELIREHGYERVPISHASTVAAPSYIEDTVFESSGLDSHIDDEIMDTMGSANPHWCTHDAANRKLAALRTMSFTDCDGKWDDIYNSFWSILMRPGVVVMRSGEKKGALVLVAGRFGFLGWVVELARNTAGVYLRFGTKGDACVAFHRVTDPQAWSCISVCAVSPGDTRFDPMFSLPGLRAMLVDKKTKLLEFAARAGFPGVLREDLQRIFNTLHIKYEKGRKPSSKADLLRAIIRRCIPECSEAEEEAAVAKHDLDEFEDVDPESAAIFDSSVLDVLIESMEDADFGEQAEALRAKYKERKAQRATRASCAAASSSAPLAALPASGAACSSGRDIVFPAGRGFTTMEGKAYLPPKALCRIDGWHTSPRWQLRAPWMTSVSKSFDRDDWLADREAFLYCLRRCWQERTRLFSDVCPWNLGELAF